MRGGNDSLSSYLLVKKITTKLPTENSKSTTINFLDPLARNLNNYWHMTRSEKKVVVVLGFYVPPTAKVIRRRDLGLKSHPKDWRSPESNSGPLVYKAGSLTARPRRLLEKKKKKK